MSVSSTLESIATAPSWPEILAATERIHWRVEDLIGPDKSFDLGRDFLPDSLARSRTLPFLDEEQRRTLNQIRGYGYLHMFGLVEEFILPFALDHARPRLTGDDARARALLAFADEEAKHIDLFRRFKQEFERRLGWSCDVIGPADAVAKFVLSHDELAVALVVLQLEWMTQRHWIEAVSCAGELDERFKSLLRHHWMEEAQHAHIDTRIVDELGATRDEAQRAAALDGYLAVGRYVDQALEEQARFDLESLERATGRPLDPTQREQLLEVQRQALRWTYLGSGMTHPKFLAALERLGPSLRERVERIAASFC